MDEKSLKREMEEIRILGILARAYAQIASARMKNIRQSVTSSRDFLLAIDEIFREVRDSYVKKVQALAKKRKTQGGEKITFLAHNGKTVAVFLSANTGLYGDIIQQTFDLFLKEVRQGGVEATIVGRLGLALFLDEEPKRPYTYFDLPDWQADEESMVKIIKHLVPYEEIHIYYGKFESVVRQTPEMFNISAQTPLEEGKGEGARIKYLFEPTLEEILIFFETEMFSSLFAQSVKESQLAKFASRVLSLDQAGENVNQSLQKMRLRQLKLAHRQIDRKQLNSLTSILFRNL
jgi:F0F1-type ATP synthase gamma subunit